MKKILVRPGIGILTAVAALAVAGIAYASIPDGSGVIHGCYSKPSKPGTPPGSLRVVDTGAGQSCDANEMPLTWNQQGQRGATGLQGPRGSTGQAGPTGPSGSAGAAGPTYFDGGEFLAPVPSSFTTLASETITGQQAGLNVITAPGEHVRLAPHVGRAHVHAMQSRGHVRNARLRDVLARGPGGNRSGRCERDAPRAPNGSRRATSSRSSARWRPAMRTRPVCGEAC